MQCYRGSTDSTTEIGGNFQPLGSCGLYGATCDPSAVGPGAGPPNGGPPPAGGPPPGRKKRSFNHDPTTDWFITLQHLHINGKSSSYGAGKLMKHFR